MFKATATLSLLLASALLAQENLTIKSIAFTGNEKIKTQTLEKKTQQFLTQPLNDETAKQVVEHVEAFYHSHNYALAYATLQESNATMQKLTIGIKKHADFSAKAIYEMEQRALQEGKISRIFFEGNKKVTTMRLMKQIEPFIGRENSEENRALLLQSVESLYKKLGYTLAFAKIKSDENGVITLSIHKR